MKSSLSPLVGALCCAFVLVADGLPTNNNGQRFKRQADNVTAPTDLKSSEGIALSTQSTPASTSSAQPSSSSSAEPPHRNNDFGLGAVAGVGGLTRGVGIGNFQFPTATASKNDPLSPWGAFAGLNLGNGGRIGAGCQGLSCGVQLGHFVLGTPQLLGLGRNILNPQQRQDQLEKTRPDGKKLPDETQTLSETNFNPNPGSPNNFAITPANPEDIRAIFRDAFRGFRETLASFFRAPVTHFIKKDRAFQIDNSTESVVGPVRSATAASEPKTYRIQLTPPKTSTVSDKESGEQENELD